jgi:hypothetical protein
VRAPASTALRPRLPEHRQSLGKRNLNRGPRRGCGRPCVRAGIGGWAAPAMPEKPPFSGLPQASDPIPQ